MTPNSYLAHPRLILMRPDTPNFQHDWEPAIFGTPGKSALVTEAGSRWVSEGKTPTSDQGSPLLVVHYLSSFPRHGRSAPGAMINWELMVGNSNTRWRWGSLPGAAEPAVPFDAHLFPDGTPVSFTEAEAIRRYVTGEDRFIFFDSFLPVRWQIIDDTYLALDSKAVETSSWDASGMPTTADVMLEAAVWLVNTTSELSFFVRAAGHVVDATEIGQPAVASGYEMKISRRSNAVELLRWRNRTASRLCVFNTTTIIDGGIDPNGWNNVRLTLEGSVLRLFLNTKLPEVMDLRSGEVTPLAPRMRCVDPEPVLSPGGLKVRVAGGQARVDYVSILSPSVVL